VRALDPSTELIALARRTDEKTFVAKHKGIFLVVSEAGDAAPEANVRETRRTERDHLAAAPAPKSFKIVPVARRGTSPFADMVTLGRAEENDIVVRHTTVSKLHACFQENAAGVWTLTDKGSTNGTWVGGMRLKPDEPLRLGPSELIDFGDCTFALKAADGLWRFIGAAARAQAGPG
jgi:hypothetical protein